ncbi:MAG: GSCFA domain-containing protein [Arcobacter sp.]|uniref:GSCFA domain-containing protein n=1 Tax=Arcobacter sp. TaxID=1872629 RepID=UPI003C784095
MSNYTSEEALSNRTNNKFSTWHKEINGKKDEHCASKRVLEDYLQVSINPSFKFNAEDPIFTMGSCFARRLENILHKKGNNVPMYRDMLKNKDIFENSTSFNKYNTYSMLYELLWVLEEEKYEQEYSIIEVGKDKFMDLQSVPGDFNLNSYENILKRKEKVFSLTRNVIDAKVITLTLGLNEVWFDKKTQRYLNITPDIKFAKKDSNRFELRILSADGASFIIETFLSNYHI